MATRGSEGGEAERAEALRHKGDVAGARKLAREALAHAKSDVARGKLLAVIARADLDGGEASAASKALEEATRLCEAEPLVRAEVELDLGRARRRGGDLEGALRALAHSVELFRQSGSAEGARRALAQRGKVLYAKGDMKGARAAFRAALELDGKEPESWRLHHAVARAYEKEGRAGDADKSYRFAREAGWDGRAKAEIDAVSSAVVADLGTLEARRGSGSPLLAGREKLSGEVLPALDPARGGSRPGPGPSSDPGGAQADEDADALARSVEALSREDLVRLVSLSGALASPVPPAALLELLLDRGIAWTSAEKGYVVLCSPEDQGRVEVRAARAAGAQNVIEPEDELSRNTVRKVVATGATIVTDDATRDERLLGFSSVAEKGLRSIACVPLRATAGSPGRRTLGALYLERRDRSGAFGTRERALLEALGTQVAVALDRSMKTARLEDDYKETKRALDERTGVAFGIVGRARAMRHVFRLIEKVRGHDSPVLIEGDTGTGKELVARAIHRSSRRENGPFVVESCGAMSETLLEAELFGHEKGAFTGATESRRGAFERANGGTLFLDEVGDMPARMQALLLRALETREVRPLGAPAPRRVDCRIIAAGRGDLRQLVASGQFREDLYFRLNVIKIQVPALRERKEDIPALAEAFLRELGRPASALSPRALEALLAHDWPGNVRELKHTIERASLLAGENQIDARHLGLEGDIALGISSGSAVVPGGALPPGASPGDGSPLAPRPPMTGPAPQVGKVSFRGHVLNRRQLALIEYLRANGVATNREYGELVKVSTATGWRDLKDLLDKGVIRAEGQGRNTVYRLDPGVKDVLGTSTTD